MIGIARAIQLRLDALAAGEVPQREKPSAHDHGLLTTALAVIVDLTNESRIAKYRRYYEAVERVLKTDHHDDWSEYQAAKKALQKKGAANTKVCGCSTDLSASECGDPFDPCTCVCHQTKGGNDGE